MAEYTVDIDESVGVEEPTEVWGTPTSAAALGLAHTRVKPGWETLEAEEEDYTTDPSDSVGLTEVFVAARSTAVTISDTAGPTDESDANPANIYTVATGK